MPDDETESVTVGWREWVALPDLGIPAIKAKIDTGARTSALHAFMIAVHERDGREYVRFSIHPLQRRNDIVLACEAPVLERRVVRDSGGHTEERNVIETRLRMGKLEWPIEITLTSRDDMSFRMLLGRTALESSGLAVNPSESYLVGRRPRLPYGKRRKIEK